MKPWSHVLSLHGLIDNCELEWLRANAFGRAVELGSLEGKSSCAIASSVDVNSLTCIDLWPEDFRWLHFWENVDGFPITGIKADSVVAAATFPDASVDFVFIDTNHTYESTIAEIAAWLPKLREGGLMCGHDYNNEGYTGLAKAVDEKLPKRQVQHSIWFNYIP